MPSKNNRLNHDFQIVYFLAGSCHTADGAYAMLKGLLEEREGALAGVRSAELRLQARRAKLEEAQKNGPLSAALEAEADLLELEAAQDVVKRNIEAARAEAATIRKCIELVQPLRQFKHLPDPEAFEAAQCEEWARELVYRAENFLITMGTVPHDHFATMRQHPQFRERIAPVLLELDVMLQTPTGREQLMHRVAQAKPEFLSLPGLQALALPAPEV